MRHLHLVIAARQKSGDLPVLAINTQLDLAMDGVADANAHGIIIIEWQGGKCMKYAYVNPIDGVILQWIDTSRQNYNLPDSSRLHECTDAEFELRNNGEHYMVQNGTVVPFAAVASPIASDAQIRAQIDALESQQTPRRLREAVIGKDGGWLANVEAQIDALRAQLK